jgi:hypothetical protein
LLKTKIDPTRLLIQNAASFPVIKEKLQALKTIKITIKSETIKNYMRNNKQQREVKLNETTTNETAASREKR